VPEIVDAEIVGETKSPPGTVHWRGLDVPQVVSTNYPYNLVKDLDFMHDSTRWGITLPQDKAKDLKTLIDTLAATTGKNGDLIQYRARYARTKGDIYMIFLEVDYSDSLQTKVAKKMDAAMQSFKMYGVNSFVGIDKQLQAAVNNKMTAAQLKDFKDKDPAGYSLYRNNRKAVLASQRKSREGSQRVLVVSFNQQNVTANPQSKAPEIKLVDYPEFEAYVDKNFPTEISSLKNQLVSLDDARVKGARALLRATDEEGDTEVFKVGKNRKVFSDFENSEKYGGKKSVMIFSKLSADEFAAKVKELTTVTIKVPR